MPHVHGEIVDPVLQSELAALQVTGSHTLRWLWLHHFLRNSQAAVRLCWALGSAAAGPGAEQGARELLVRPGAGPVRFPEPGCAPASRRADAHGWKPGSLAAILTTTSHSPHPPDSLHPPRAAEGPQPCGPRPPARGSPQRLAGRAAGAWASDSGRSGR